MKYLIYRNAKLYSKDKISLFFSFLSPLIMVVLYFCFFRNTEASDIQLRISDYLYLSSVIVYVSFSVSIGNLGQMIDDRIKGTDKDFLITPLSNTQLFAGMVTSSVIVSSLISCLIALVYDLCLPILGYSTLPLSVLLKLFGIGLASSIISNICLCLPISILKTHGAYSAFSTICGILVGFISGIYVPIGSMGDTLQKLVLLNPITHLARFSKAVIYDSIPDINSIPVEAQHTVRSLFGIDLSFGEKTVTMLHSLIFLGVVAIVFGLLDIRRARK